MDYNEIWQENKRWILGVALGAIVFWIGTLVIDGLYSAEPTERLTSKAQRAVRSEDGFYDSSARTAAESEHEELGALRQRLDKTLEFVPLDEFLLAGKGLPDLHFDSVSRRIKRQLVDSADALGVELDDKDLAWKAPEGREQIQSSLISLCLLEQAARRLMKAHEQVRAADPAAIGLAAIDSLRIDDASRRRQRPVPRRRRDQNRIDVADWVSEENVRFKFRADSAVVQLFLELCRRESPVISLAPDFKMVPGRAAGDPLVVSGVLSAIRLRDAQ